MPTGQYLRRPHTKERKKNISKSMKGKKFSEEHKRKISERQSGEKHNQYKGEKEYE